MLPVAYTHCCQPAGAFGAHTPLVQPAPSGAAHTRASLANVAGMEVFMPPVGVHSAPIIPPPCLSLLRNAWAAAICGGTSHWLAFTKVYWVIAPAQAASV